MSEVKVPKGTRDINPYQAAVRQEVVRKVQDVFRRHGAVTIETPVFELRSVLMGKYGEDSKLIYDLADQGGESCCLRYDLTVPFARYVAQYQIDKMKRYHIGKVYRRDQPIMTKGRFREFVQCDFDIAGPYDPMLPDAECCRMMTEIFDSLEVGQYVIKINHRQLLDGIFEFCGVPEHLFRPICSAVDKLDKESWADVKKEMLEKGLDGNSADKIGEFVVIKGQLQEVVEQLRGHDLSKNENAAKAIEDMGLLAGYVEQYGVAENFSFDLSLARGLDYYTGVIYEAVLVGANVGSVAGGGRYDNLVGMYGKKQVPCVGFSVGIERLFNILEANAKESGTIRESPTDVVLVSIGKEMLGARMQLARELWDGGINAELLHKKNAKPKQQLDMANNIGAPFVCIIGEDEVTKGIVQVKDMKTSQQTEVARAGLVAHLRKLTKPAGAVASAPVAQDARGVPSGFADIKAFDEFMADRSYVDGIMLGARDVAAWRAMGSDVGSAYPHASRLFRAVAYLTPTERKNLEQA